MKYYIDNTITYNENNRYLICRDAEQLKYYFLGYNKHKDFVYSTFKKIEGLTEQEILPSLILQKFIIFVFKDMDKEEYQDQRYALFDIWGMNK